MLTVRWIPNEPPFGCQTPGLNTKFCHMSPFLSHLCLIQETYTKNIRVIRQGLHAPTIAVCSLNIHGGMQVLSGLGGATCRQRLVKAPQMLHLPPSGRLANMEIYWSIYVMYHLTFTHWYRGTMRQGISNFLWLALSVVFYVGSARQTDGQLSSAPIISSTYAIRNLRPKYSCSIRITIKVPPPHNP